MSPSRWILAGLIVALAAPAAAQPQPPAGQPPAGQPPAGQPPAGQPPAGQPPAGQPLAPSWSFPCSDVPGPRGGLQPSEQVISQDWLSGDVPIVGQANVKINTIAGHIVYTYTNDTEDLVQIKTLFGIIEGLAFLLITPSILLVGYQLM